MADPVGERVGDLIDRLLAHADPSFVPPPFVADVSERALGPSGAARTPHRRLLERANGGYFHGHALHVFGACDAPPWHALPAWNDPAGWRAHYPDLPTDLVCFAEDAFGDQFAYNHVGGEVVTLEAELGRVVPAAPTFVAWLEEMVDRPAALLPLDVIASLPPDRRVLPPGMQLFAYPPLFSAESRDGVEVGHVDAHEAMRFRGQLAAQIRGLPPGSRIAIDFDD